MSTFLPTFNRQKFLLIFIKYAGDRLSKLDFQKLLFLYQKQTDTTYFDFIPYHYGCYSFQANSDLEILQSSGWLKLEEKEITLLNYPEKGLEGNLRQAIGLKKFMSDNSNLRGDSLIRLIYKDYPYYAINSKIIGSSHLDNKDIEEIKRVKNRYLSNETVLFTIGYEGAFLESYINKLIQKDVHLLCDVRSNPLSRKYGFSKGSLSVILPKIGIKYEHIPELGIPSSERKDVKESKDYMNLFDVYKDSLQNKGKYVKQLFELINKHKRVALTCFEKEPTLCHRYYLSHFLKSEYNIRISDL